jgi:hemolysin activation/secretion protein
MTFSFAPSASTLNVNLLLVVSSPIHVLQSSQANRPFHQRQRKQQRRIRKVESHLKQEQNPRQEVSPYLSGQTYLIHIFFTIRNVEFLATCIEHSEINSLGTTENARNLMTIHDITFVKGV